MRLIRQIPKPTANQPTIRRPIHKTQHKLDATLKLTEDLREMSSSYAHMDLGQLEEIQAAAILAANRITLAAKKVQDKIKNKEKEMSDLRSHQEADDGESQRDENHEVKRQQRHGYIKKLAEQIRGLERELDGLAI